MIKKISLKNDIFINFSNKIKKIPKMDHKNSTAKNNFTNKFRYNPKVEKKEKTGKENKKKGTCKQEKRIVSEGKGSEAEK